MYDLICIILKIKQLSVFVGNFTNDQDMNIDYFFILFHSITLVQNISGFM